MMTLKYAVIQVLTCVLTISVTMAQDVNYNWAKVVHGKNIANFNGNIIDGNKNFYAIGSFADTIDFDPGPFSFLHGVKGLIDGFITKYDTNGNFIWVKSFGGTNQTVCQDVALDSNNNLYIVGEFIGTTDFDPGLNSFNLSSRQQSNGNHMKDVFVVKLNSDGDFLWAKTVGSLDWDLAKAVAVDRSGNVLIGGYFRRTVDFDPGPGVVNKTSQGGGTPDAYILKLDENGDFVWIKTFGGSSTQLVQSIVVDDSSNIYSTGYYSYNTDFDPDSNSYVQGSKSNSVDVFVQKLDSNGNFLWVQTFGSTFTDKAEDMAIDQWGNILVTGEFQLKMNLYSKYAGFRLESTGSYDVFAVRMGPNGDYLWAGGFGGKSSDEGRGIAVDQFGDFYVTGTFRDTADFNPDDGRDSIISFGNRDIFLTKIDSAGTYKWTQAFGAKGQDIGSDVAIGDKGEMYITGTFHDTIDFDPNPPIAELVATVNEKDLYLLKLDQNCFFPLDTSIAIVGNTLSSNAINVSYQWMKCDSVYSVLSNDTNKIFTATENGLYALEITSNMGCVDTSSCIQVSGIGVGVEEKRDDMNVSVYPNPSTGIFTLSFSEINNYSLRIIDMNAQTVYQKDNLHSRNHQLELNVEPGIYLIIIQTQDSLIHHKITFL